MNFKVHSSIAVSSVGFEVSVEINKFSKTLLWQRWELMMPSPGQFVFECE